MFNSVLVLESPWDADSVRSTSVWPFVSEFAKVRGIHAYYQSFTDSSSFQHWVSCFDKEKTRGPKLLYVAAHGSSGRISGLRRSINASKISSVLGQAESIEHVHFGSCFYGTVGNLESLLASVKHLKTAAGYDKPIDWVDSMLFDILLWGRVVGKSEDEEGEATRIRKATLVQRLLDESPGLASALGFHFRYRYGKERVFGVSNSGNAA